MKMIFPGERRVSATADQLAATLGGQMMACSVSAVPDAPQRPRSPSASCLMRPLAVAGLRLHIPAGDPGAGVLLGYDLGQPLLEQLADRGVAGQALEGELAAVAGQFIRGQGGQRVPGRIDGHGFGGHRWRVLPGVGAVRACCPWWPSGRTVDREHALLYRQRWQVWQARSVGGEVWQMGSRRDPDRSALAVFADELRAQRDLAGLSRDELAARLNYSASLISMIESGHRSPSRDFAGRCDEAFGTPGTLARLEKRLRDVPFSSGFRPFQPYESEATSLRLFEHTLIPGLLQTEAYARAVLETHPNTSRDVVEERVAARIARQVILDREEPAPPMLWVLLDENVLAREVGGRKVMHDQLVHLAEAARRPNVTVQVIPGVGAHPGLLGAFAIAELTGLPAIVYLETAHEGQTLEDPDVGARMSVRFDALRTEALTGRASLSLIEKVIEERWTN